MNFYSHYCFLCFFMVLFHDVCNGIEEQGGRCSHVNFAFDYTFEENFVENLKSYEIMTY
jgi:hypothetical protein